MKRVDLSPTMLPTMALTSLFKKASNLLGLGSPESNRPPPLDGEIIYCKNNVCVHPPAALSRETQHHPGYLNIRSQEDKVVKSSSDSSPRASSAWSQGSLVTRGKRMILNSTLILTWIPNSTLKNNPRSIENSPNRGGKSPRISPRRSPRQEYAQTDYPSPTSSQSPEESLSSGGDTKEHNRCNHNAQHNDDSCQSEHTGNDGKKHTKRISDPADCCKCGANHQGTCEKPGCNRINRTQANCPDGDEVFQGDSHSVPTSPSTESDSPSTEHQLFMMLHKKKLQDRVKERTGSNRSVTSIEMDGDNLVVVTEEIEDMAFEEPDNMDKEYTHTYVNSGKTVNNAKAKELDTIGVPKKDSESNSMSSNSTNPSPSGEHYMRMAKELQDNLKLSGKEVDNNHKGSKADVNSTCRRSPAPEEVERLKGSLDLQLNSVSAPVNTNMNVTTPDISITGSVSSSSTATSGPDSRPPTPVTPLELSPLSPPSPASLEVPSSPEFAHNFSFPENSVGYGSSPAHTAGKSAKEQVCGVFSVDLDGWVLWIRHLSSANPEHPAIRRLYTNTLQQNEVNYLSQMRSLRIFYNDDACTSGQLVIASRESQYKILHFHHGGLDHLADTFADWKFLSQPENKKLKSIRGQCRHFSVIRPYLPEEQSHPEEGAYEPVNEETWKTHMNEQGFIEDHFHLRKAIFFAGLEPSLRHEMWPFLLQYYPYNSTHEEREHMRNDKYIEYLGLRKQRESMSVAEREQFWRSIQCTVEKDVVRTDRTHPYFKGDDNPNIEILKNILLNYAVAHPHHGYTQGMSDLLAPLLVEIQQEADAYWCFVGLMQRTIFVSSPKDVDMDKQLLILRELLRLMLPRFYAHLQKVQDGMELLFCHRWILLCFKREFPEADALRIWEACWAHYQTDYFHLFVCVAIIAVYGEDVVQQDLPADEMLLHFSSLAMHMSGIVVLRKARGLLHQFRLQQVIPCTLAEMCSLCEPGIWDSGHVPTVKCIGHPLAEECPYGGSGTNTPTTPKTPKSPKTKSSPK